MMPENPVSRRECDALLRSRALLRPREYAVKRVFRHDSQEGLYAPYAPRDGEEDRMRDQFGQLLFGGRPGREPGPMPDRPDFSTMSTWESFQIMAMWLQNVWVNVGTPPTDNPQLGTFDWMSDALVTEFVKYAMTKGCRSFDRGGTLEESWLSSQLIQHTPLVCLLNGGWPHTAYPRITRQIRLGADALISELGLLVRLGGPVATFVSDGEWGHAIRVVCVRDETVGFHDPWPGRSLLCEENNAAGVAAIPGPDAGLTLKEAEWAVPARSFATVLVASFVISGVWEMQHPT